MQAGILMMSRNWLPTAVPQRGKKYILKDNTLKMNSNKKIN